jgi:KipI family sensor histidine kinase inhibitor
MGAAAFLLDAQDPAAAAGELRRLAAVRGLALTEIVPGAETVLVSGPDASAAVQLWPAVDRARASLMPAADPILIDVRYDGPDVAAVADATGLTVVAVIERHSAAAYRAAFSGFAPGFAYLTGLDPALELPRRANPRPRVPAGSVAIAAGYSAVYPRSSPGGWHLLGTTDAVLFDPDRDPPALIAPGAPVRFRPVR